MVSVGQVVMVEHVGSLKKKHRIKAFCISRFITHSMSVQVFLYCLW